MRRTVSLVIAIFGLTLGTVVAADDEKSAVPSAADADRVARQEEQRVLKALSRKIDFRCTDMSIDESMFQISEAIETEFLFDFEKIRDEGISTENTTVTLNAGTLTAWQVLHFLLEPHHLTWVANDGVLEITTKAAAQEVLVTRVYDVRNLCKLLEPHTREMLEHQRRGKHKVGGGVGMFSLPIAPIAWGALGQFGNAGPAAPQNNQPPKFVRLVESLLATMLMNCTTLKWMEQEGEGGSVQLGQGCLIISQTYRGQFEIAGLLESLEKLVEGKTPGKSIAARRIGYPVEEEAKIFETLAKRSTIEVEAESLDNAIRKVIEANNLPVWIDQTRLSEEGIALDQLISSRRKFQKLPLAICLKKILEPFHLSFVVDEGVVVITTQNRANEILSVRLYDIGGISKIAHENPASGVVSVLSRSTHGRWEEFDGDGGTAALISSKHLAVLQTQHVHSEIALLIDDLSREELMVPAQPEIELRVYTLPSAQIATDLARTLPQLLQVNWLPNGSISSAGETLLIKQPATVHSRIEEVLDKLEESYKRKNPQNEPEKQKTSDGADQK